MKIVTFNLRMRWDNDGINSFIHRAGLIYEKITAEMPDIVAFQECRPRHLELLQKLMPGYLFVGRERDESGEGVYTAIKKESCRLEGFEVFWLGPDMYLPGSRFEGQSKNPRICLTTRIRHQISGRVIRVYNVHLDHISSAIAAKGIECVLQKMAEDSGKGKADIVLLGDFNAKPGTAALLACEAFQNPPLTEVTREISGTYHGFGEKEPVKIDYIFTSPDLANRVQTVERWEEQKNGIYLSDHYPVCAAFDFE